MSYRLLKTGSCKGTARVSDYMPVGRYNALVLVVHGTTDTSQTLAKADIGRIRVEYMGQELQGRDFAFYHDYTDLMGGHPARILPEAGASRILAAVPFAHPGYPNTLDVTGPDQATYYLDFNAALDTRFGSNAGTYELYALEIPDIPMGYHLLTRQQDIEVAAAGRPETTLRIGNVGSLYLRDSSSVVGNVQVSVDGEILVNNIDATFLKDVTNLERRIESAGQDLKEVLVAGGVNIEETLNRNIEMQTTFTAAGTLEVTALAFRWLNNDANASIQRVQARRQRRRGLAFGNLPRRPAGAVST